MILNYAFLKCANDCVCLVLNFHTCDIASLSEPFVLVGAPDGSYLESAGKS